MPQLTNPENKLTGMSKQREYFCEVFIHEMKNKIFEYEKGPELERAKSRYLVGSDEGYIKKIGNALGYFYRKAEKKPVLEEWAHRIWEFVGVSAKKDKLMLENFMVLLEPSKSAFIGEFCVLANAVRSGGKLENFKLGQNPDEIEGE